jgi:hypothetical protein
MVFNRYYLSQPSEIIEIFGERPAAARNPLKSLKNKNDNSLISFKTFFTLPLEI